MNKYLLLSLLFLLWSSTSLASSPGDDAYIDDYLKDILSLQASFTQSVEGAVIDLEERTSGQIFVQRPGLMRWVYTTPKEQVIIADGRYVWFHDVELEQVTQVGQKNALKGTPAEVLIGERKVSEAFDILYEGEQDGIYWYELSSKAKEPRFKTVRLGFDISGDLSTLSLLDEFDQITFISLSDIRKNEGIDIDTFRFTAPEGADIFSE